MGLLSLIVSLFLSKAFAEVDLNKANMYNFYNPNYVNDPKLKDLNFPWGGGLGYGGGLGNKGMGMSGNSGMGMGMSEGLMFTCLSCKTDVNVVDEAAVKDMAKGVGDAHTDKNLKAKAYNLVYAELAGLYKNANALTRMLDRAIKSGDGAKEGELRTRLLNVEQTIKAVEAQARETLARSADSSIAMRKLLDDYNNSVSPLNAEQKKAAEEVKFTCDRHEQMYSQKRYSWATKVQAEATTLVCVDDQKRVVASAAIMKKKDGHYFSYSRQEMKWDDKKLVLFRTRDGFGNTTYEVETSHDKIIEKTYGFNAAGTATSVLKTEEYNLSKDLTAAEPSVHSVGMALNMGYMGYLQKQGKQSPVVFPYQVPTPSSR